MGMDGIRLIIFDFDGTLGDTRRNILLTMRQTLEELSLPVASEEECAATIGLPLRDCFLQLFPDLSDELADRCAATYRRIFDINKKQLVPALFPHVRETLAKLYARGYILSTISPSSSVPTMWHVPNPIRNQSCRRSEHSRFQPLRLSSSVTCPSISSWVLVPVPAPVPSPMATLLLPTSAPPVPMSSSTLKATTPPLS